MLLPQRPYIPSGTLKTAVAYPDVARTYGSTAVREALELTRLAALAREIDSEDNWPTALLPRDFRGGGPPRGRKAPGGGDWIGRCFPHAGGASWRVSYLASSCCSSRVRVRARSWVRWREWPLTGRVSDAGRARGWPR
jgi:hypothetical protein